MAEDAARRRSRVLTMAAAGLSDQAIADHEAREAGDGSVPRPASAIAGDLTAALASRRRLTDAQAVALELERLNALQRSVEAVLRAASQTGRCAACHRSGDPALVLAAADRLVRIGEHRAALLAVDPAGRKPEDTADELRLRRDRKQISPVSSTPPRQERGPVP